MLNEMANCQTPLTFRIIRKIFLIRPLTNSGQCTQEWVIDMKPVCVCVSVCVCVCVCVWTMNSPRCSDSCRPLSPFTTRSSSMSHLFPTSSTWALSHEYVLIWVDLGTNTPSSQRETRSSVRSGSIRYLQSIVLSDSICVDRQSSDVI